MKKPYAVDLEGRKNISELFGRGQRIELPGHKLYSIRKRV